MTEHDAIRSELTWIRGLMEEGQRALANSWQHQALWGVLGAVGLSLTWWFVQADRAQAMGWLWPGLLVVGWAASLWLGRRARTRGPVRGTAGRLFGSLWVGTGVTLTLLGTSAMWSPVMAPGAVPGLLAAVLGAGYFASGALAGMAWLRTVAALWWAVAVTLLVLPGPWTLLGLALAALVLQVGTALLLRAGAGSAVPSPAPPDGAGA